MQDILTNKLHEEPLLDETLPPEEPLLNETLPETMKHKLSMLSPV